MHIPEAFRPMVHVWSHYNYACLMGGMTPSLITLWMLKIGQLWLAWELTKSNAWVGLIVAADYAPMMFMAPFVGAFTEKTDPVRVQKLAQVATLIIAVLLAVFTFTGVMNIWILLVLSLVLGCVHPFNAISRHTIVPATVPKPEIPTALATDSAIYNAARFIGPAVAGYVIAIGGVGYAFVAHIAGILAYMIGLSMMRLDFSDRTSHGHGNMMADIAEGLRYVCRHPGIGPLFLIMTIGAVWIRPLQDLLPGFADKVFEAGPPGLGWLTAAMGVGATVSAALVAMYARTMGLTLVVLLGFLANMVATVLFCATNWLWLTALFAVVWGGTLTMMSTGTQALVQSSVDNSIRARVMSLYTMIYRGAPFLGAIVIGLAADYIGLQLAFIAATLLCVVPWIIIFARRAAMTAALEGRSNDLDERLLAATKAWAGMAYEQAVDLKARAAPLAGKVRDQSRALVTRAKEARLGERLGGLTQRGRRDDLK